MSGLRQQLEQGAAQLGLHLRVEQGLQPHLRA